MKTYLFYVTTEDDWEWARSSYLVTADSKEEALKLFKMEDSWERSIDEILEVDLSVKGQIKIQDSVVE